MTGLLEHLASSDAVVRFEVRGGHTALVTLNRPNAKGVKDNTRKKGGNV